MSATQAIVDATRHSTANPVDLEVAGLGMLERTVRLAAVAGCEEAVVVADDPAIRDHVDRIRGKLHGDPRFQVDIQFLESPSSSFAQVLERTRSAIAATGGVVEHVLYLESTAVYHRTSIEQMLHRVRRREDVCTSGGDADSDELRVFAASARGWRQMADLGAVNSFSSVRELVDTVATLGSVSTARIFEEMPDDRWIRIRDGADADRAAESIWDSCIKPEDGPVSRYINRPLSLALSRRLAPFAISPNEITGISALFGLASGLVAAAGGYLAVVVGAILYQIKSIVDGSDGEIARAKYEFTDLGAWFDKFVDDLSHLSFAVGATIGVVRSGATSLAGLESGAEFWWGVIGVTILGKLVDSAAWYGSAFRDGTLQHPLEVFEWWFEDETGPGEASGAAVLGYLKPLTKGGVFILLALLSAVAGIIGLYLVLFAAGQLGVGLARVHQAWRQTRR